MPLAKMDSFMKYANFFYKCVGIEPYSSHERPKAASAWITFVFWANIVNVVFIMIAEFSFVVKAVVDKEIVLAVMVMSYIGFIGVGLSKMFFVWLNKATLSHIVRDLEDLFPRDKPAQVACKLDYYLNSCSRISFMFSMLYSVAIWTFNLFNLIQYVIYDWWLQTRIVPETLPYPVYVPWDPGHGLKYLLMFFNQNFAGYTSAAGQVSTDLLLCAVITQIIMHFNYLSQKFEDHQLTGDWAQDSRLLSEVVHYHNRLLRLSDQLNEIFGVPLILNFLISSFVLCFVSFELTVGVRPDEAIKLLLFLGCSLSQAYLICYHGQLIVDASSGFSMAAYNQNWIMADERYRKALVFIMMRSQDPTYLKATVFIQITRGTMTDLLQLSYKFFALLRTMYVK
ncbi:odorant receptor 85c [Drosophila mojavensis]|uniref:Odorant receptor n=1 Tax=Drosophila mojavensis TaxID=7230 RepID=A0A0Q9X7X7_DROMO|nr:odorant receptor 85c [Drosophila mojavensis]KRG00647.1 uncharacterized protein Dmoj_GI26557 [Drosophila mojavensis]